MKPISRSSKQILKGACESKLGQAQGISRKNAKRCYKKANR